jgi:hypothetical protein
MDTTERSKPQKNPEEKLSTLSIHLFIRRLAFEYSWQVGLKCSKFWVINIKEYGNGRN